MLRRDVSPSSSSPVVNATSSLIIPFFEAVLVARLYAMFHRSRPILMTLIAVFFVTLLAEGILFGMQVRTEHRKS